MRTILSIVVLVLAFACNQEEKKSSDEAVPHSQGLTTIQWLDTAKSVGKINEGEKVQIDFRFINSGPNPLVISNIGVSCGCTVAEKPGELIAPGKEGVIKAIFDSKNRVGTNHKSLTVYANTEKPMHPLAFEVEVVPAKK